MVVTAGTAGGSHEFAVKVRARKESRPGCRGAGRLTSRPAETRQNVNAMQVLAQLGASDLMVSHHAARIKQH